MNFDLAQARADTPGVNHVAHLNNAGASLAPKPVVDDEPCHICGKGQATASLAEEQPARGQGLALGDGEAEVRRHGSHEPKQLVGVMLGRRRRPLGAASGGKLRLASPQKRLHRRRVVGGHQAVAGHRYRPSTFLGTAVRLMAKTDMTSS